jgi:hypothetical protein
VLSRVDSGLGAAEAISAVLERPDQPPQQPPPPGGDAKQPASGGEDPHGLRLQLPAVLKREQIESLATLGFVERKENVVFLGPPGCRQDPPGHRSRHRRRPARPPRLLRHPGRPDHEPRGGPCRRQALHRMKTLTHPSLLVVDEIGYLPVSRTGAMHFFQLMSRRYEHASTVLTSNKSFEEWGEIFGDEVMAAALIDRLLHHCHIVNIRGNSFRMRSTPTSGSNFTTPTDGASASASTPPRRTPGKKEVTT